MLYVVRLAVTEGEWSAIVSADNCADAKKEAARLVPNWAQQGEVTIEVGDCVLASWA